MGYISGSILNDPAPADALIAAIEAEMTAVGWVFVEEVVATYTYRIWRSPAANNDFGVDWYLHTFRVNDTEVRYGVSEGYDSATNEVTGFAANNNATTIASDGTANIGGPPSRTTLGSGYIFYMDFDGLNTVETRYWFLVTPENVIGKADSANDADVLYAGFFDPLKPGIANNVPLANIRPGTNGSSGGGLSRVAEEASGGTGGTGWSGHMAVMIYTVNTAVFHQYAAPGASHPLHDVVPIGRWVIRHFLEEQPRTIERFRGFARHLRCVSNVVSGPERGDTLSDGIDTYVCLHPSSGIWLKTTNIGTA